MSPHPLFVPAYAAPRDGGGSTVGEILDGPAGPNSLPRFDFRKPSKFGREHIRSLESLHESFARRFASLLTHSLRSVLQLKPVAVDEITYENYVRSLPNPSVLAVVSLAPLPGGVILEMSAPTGLVIVDRALGGFGGSAPLRRPTDIETRVLAEVIRSGLGAFQETFAPLLEVRPEVTSVETNPNFVQVVSPSETTLLLSYSLVLSASTRAEGLLTLCYPFSTLQPVMDRLHRHISVEQPAGPEAEPPGGARVREHVEDLSVTLDVILKPTSVLARDIATLRPGDVLRLDHRVDEPALGVVGDVVLLAGFVGRRGKRLGLRVSDWRSNDG
ncbi:MAG TPA: FliM/FliN family flagellar motor switch protein [Actinomycetota bacterium]|nr:FliM/FliN family flagellar motor switch protein [Actinomycetota bacterium]